MKEGRQSRSPEGTTERETKVSKVGDKKIVPKPESCMHSPGTPEIRAGASLSQPFPLPHLGASSPTPFPTSCPKGSMHFPDSLSTMSGWNEELGWVQVKAPCTRRRGYYCSEAGPGSPSPAEAGPSPEAQRMASDRQTLQAPPSTPPQPCPHYPPSAPPLLLRSHYPSTNRVQLGT